MIEWNDRLMVHDYPECGPGGITLDELYAMFKKRLAEEVPCPATWQPVLGGPVVPCTLLAGHGGKHIAPEPT